MKQISNLSRRNFAAALGALSAARRAAAQTAPPTPPAPGNFRRPLAPDTPAFEGPLEFHRRPVAPKVEPFPMAQVRLLPGNIYANARDWNSGYMSRLEADRLLYTFRANAGSSTGSAKPLGGWEQPENGQRSSELRGHFVGHFLSATAQQAANGDSEAKSKGDYLVAELAKCQQKLGGAYLSAFPLTWFDRLDAGQRVWAPFYTIHKIMAGMLDMHLLAGNQQALQVLEGMAAWADQWTAPKTEAHMQEILTIEFGGIAETLYRLAALTGNDTWARTGDRFQKKSFLNPLAGRRDELRGLHANTHIPQVIAAACRCDVSSDPRFRGAAGFFFDEVTTTRTYATGGTSNAECWLSNPGQLAAEWKLSVDHAECCCAYNMLKLARHLYSWSPNPAYFDYYEHLLLNHRIGTIRPEVGYTQYYLSLAPGVWKTFNTEDHTFWCCTGSGVEEYSKLNDSIYWRDAAGIYVNLFIPSELDWAEKGLRLRQETKYPESEQVAITVTAAKPEKLALRIRVPGWLQSTPSASLNGKPLDAMAAPGSYLVLDRVWRAGDRIELNLPMRLSVQSMPDDPSLQAFSYGPLVLAGDLGNEGLTESHIIGPNLRVGAPDVEQHGSPLGPANRVPPVPGIDIPVFKALGADPESWIKPAGPFSFRTTGQRRDVSFLPLNKLFDRRYSVYWKVG